MMLTRFSLIFLSSLVCCAIAAPIARAETIHFAGNATERTDTFETDGPWVLDWSVQSSSKLPCNFQIWANDGKEGLPCNLELRLLDGDTGKYLGTIAQLEGEGRGFKLFESAGSYRIDVIAQHVVWELLIEQIDEERAAQLQALTEKGPSLAVRAKAAARQVAEGSFSSWRPVDDQTLLLFAEDETRGFRITFEPACPGLSDAKALSFVTVFGPGVERYDSILLDDATRCYFKEVTPTVFE